MQITIRLIQKTTRIGIMKTIVKTKKIGNYGLMIPNYPNILTMYLLEGC